MEMQLRKNKSLHLYGEVCFFQGLKKQLAVDHDANLATFKLIIARMKGIYEKETIKRVGNDR